MKRSEFYESYWHRARNIPAEQIFELARRKEKLQGALTSLPKGAPVLDAGCGSGEFSAFMVDLGFSVSSIDISATAVEHASKRCPEATFKVASLDAELPFDDGTFAAVWCTEVIEHVFHVHGALAELNRVIRPGGRLVLTTPYHGLLKNLVIALLRFEKHYHPYLSHIRFFTRRSLRMCMDHAGFSVVTWSGFGWFRPLWKSHFVVAQKAGPSGPAPEITG